MSASRHMKALRRFIKRLGSLATTRQDEERLRAEIEEHLELQTADNIRAGASPLEARRLALLKFGGVESMKDDYRDRRGLPAIETLIHDTRHGWRRLWRTPVLTLATIATLALGIGATSSIFTLAHAVLLKSLPVANPNELYRVGKTSRCCYQGGYSQDREFSLVSYELYTYLRDHTAGFVQLAAFPAPPTVFGVRRAGSPEAAQTYPGEFVSGNYFAMFGIDASVGRTLTAEDDRDGAPPVAVLSYRAWQQRFGSDPSIVGSVFTLNDQPFTIVGVTPPGFFGDTLRSAPPDIFLPLNTEPIVQVDTDLRKGDTHWLELIGRIEPGANPASIEAEMRVHLKAWLRSHWGEMSADDRARFPAQTLYLGPGGAGITSMREQYELWLRILLMASGLVLLIVCANVANLMLVRGMERRRQTSLSMALGARASRLVRQALTESLLLSLMGGAAGLAVAFAGTRLILQLAFPPVAGAAAIPISASPSLPVLAFALVTSLLTGVIFGIVPAWMTTRVDPIEALRGAGRATDRAGALPRKMLVVVQVALSLALLSASGLLTAALHRLETQNVGFEQDQRIVVSVNPRLGGYRAGQLSLLYRRMHDAIASVPGVSSVALCLYSPLSGGGWGAGVWVDGASAPEATKDRFAIWNRVTAGYFDVIGTPIIKGRGIGEQDTETSPRVAVINEAFARKFFNGEDPIGRHFGREAGASRELEVIGVAKDARYLTNDLDKPVRPGFFLPEAQADYTKGNLGSLFLRDIVIVTRPGASLSLDRVSQAMASVDPDLPIGTIGTLREQVAGQFRQQRLAAGLISFFGLLSLLLASIGLYGLTAYTAARRVREIGVRMALGADRGQVVRLILRGSFGLILIGLCAGLPLTFIVGRVLGHQLYGMSPDNPLVTLAAVVTLGLSGLIASLIPALRASVVSPVDALVAE